MCNPVDVHYEQLIRHVEEHIAEMREQNESFEDIDKELDYLRELKQRQRQLPQENSARDPS